jgi:hypothetical protein
MTDDDRQIRRGVFKRIQHVTGNDVFSVGPLDGTVSDVAAGEDPTGLLVAPHRVLEHAGVGTADGNGTRRLPCLQPVEGVGKRRGVGRVSGEQFVDELVHTPPTDGRR